MDLPWVFGFLADFFGEADLVGEDELLGFLGFSGGTSVEEPDLLRGRAGSIDINKRASSSVVSVGLCLVRAEERVPRPVKSAM